jgi:hypothetical protein
MDNVEWNCKSNPVLPDNYKEPTIFKTVWGPLRSPLLNRKGGAKYGLQPSREQFVELFRVMCRGKHHLFLFDVSDFRGFGYWLQWAQEEAKLGELTSEHYIGAAFPLPNVYFHFKNTFMPDWELQRQGGPRHSRINQERIPTDAH